MNEEDERNIKKWEKHTQIWKQEYYPLNNDKDNTLNWLKRLPRKKILDEGCGIGQWTITLAMLGFNVVGLDFSEKLLNIAKKNSKKYKLDKKCKFVFGDIRKLPFKDETFDSVLSAGIVEHVPETEKCIKEIARVLKKQGYLVIHVPHKLSMFTLNKLLQKLLGIWKAGYEKSFTKRYFRRLLRRKGFAILEGTTNKIEPVTFITTILSIIDAPLYALGLGGHHTSFLCQKIR